ncbi:MAG TPA: glycosyltransferase [Candidatus Limnocylindrales bacterium]|nr:glycosyltransferase [Candidatus Limnocylindrales bacterium]
MSDPTLARRRALLLVANPAAPYSRALRVARTLAADGFEVEIAAVADPGLPEEERDGPITIRRYAPRGPWRRFAVGAPRPEARGLGRIAHLVDLGVRAVGWPVHVRAWWQALRDEAPPADLIHAFGILTVPIALELSERSRRAGRLGRTIYDVIDVILESNNVAQVPAPLLAWYRGRERRWARRVDAVVTVNEPIAEHLVARWGLPSPPTVLLNCQPRWQPPDRRPNRIREASGLPPERRLVLFLGRLGRERGLDEAAEAVLRVRDAALVLLGFGPWAERLRARDRDPRYAGHHVTLPPVHPDEVPAWTASADVSIVAVPANSLNQRLSTPNKFWESIAAGTPLVVGRDLVVMREIVEREGIGAVADPLDPDDLARAISEVLDQPAEAYEAMRTRCLQLAHARFNWETAAEPYRHLVARLSPR